MNAELVLYQKDYLRILLATYSHFDNAHIFYNMFSFLLKGKNLEPMYGSERFVGVIGMLTVLQCMLYLGFQVFAAWWVVWWWGFCNSRFLGCLIWRNCCFHVRLDSLE